MTNVSPRNDPRGAERTSQKATVEPTLYITRPSTPFTGTAEYQRQALERMGSNGQFLSLLARRNKRIHHRPTTRVSPACSIVDDCRGAVSSDNRVARTEIDQVRRGFLRNLRLLFFMHHLVFAHEMLDVGDSAELERTAVETIGQADRRARIMSHLAIRNKNVATVSRCAVERIRTRVLRK
jgi:hypothetical protein